MSAWSDVLVRRSGLQFEGQTAGLEGLQFYNAKVHVASLCLRHAIAMNKTMAPLIITTFLKNYWKPVSGVARLPVTKNP